MTDQDLFFTHTIVGQAMSVEMGRRISKKDLRYQNTLHALTADMATATFGLPQDCVDWCLIQGAYPYAGTPRRRPGATRRWLERHSLVLAGLSLVLILVLLGTAAVMVWAPQIMA